MHKILVKRLYRNHVEVNINDIMRAIETHCNLIVEYNQHFMELTWEELASKFKGYMIDPEIKYWAFKFVPNYHLLEK